MGCRISNCASEAAGISKQIDERLENDRRESYAQLKLLLLGAGECGKSTILKQMNIIHGAGYSLSDKMHYRRIVHSNVIQCFFAVLDAMEKFQIPFSDQRRLDDAERLCEMVLNLENVGITETMRNLMLVLWHDNGVRSCFARATEYQLNDSAGYFLNSIERVSQFEYIPTEEDVLKSRVRTTGIHETRFVFEGLTFRLVDVGGQRSQRKKWLHCFADVTAVIFCAALSDYDICLEEDYRVNRMNESMELFDSICNNRWLLNTCLILFLNKTDLLQQKIALTPLTICFPDYTGPDTYEGAKQYIAYKFRNLRQNKAEEVYIHFTCAIDTQNIQHVFTDISDILIKENQKACRLL